VAAFVVTWSAAFIIYKVTTIDERWNAVVDQVA